MGILAIANQKGGVGKTTTACALSAALAARGRRTLLVDCDPQCNSTDTSRAAVDGAATLYDLLLDDTTKPEDCIQHTASYDIIACDPLLRDADKKLDGISGVYRLRERLSPIVGAYDTIVMDTPPGLGVMLTGALTASGSVIVPMTPDRYALQGMTQLVKSIADVRKYTNPQLKVAGLLLTRVDSRTSIAKQISGSLPELAAQLDTEVFATSIRNTVKAQEAQSARTSIVEWAPDCTAAQDYMALVAELEGKGVI